MVPLHAVLESPLIAEPGPDIGDLSVQNGAYRGYIRGGAGEHGGRYAADDRLAPVGAAEIAVGDGVLGPGEGGGGGVCGILVEDVSRPEGDDIIRNVADPDLAIVCYHEPGSRKDCGRGVGGTTFDEHVFRPEGDGGVRDISDDGHTVAGGAIVRVSYHELGARECIYGKPLRVGWIEHARSPEGDGTASDGPDPRRSIVRVACIAPGDRELGVR